MKLFSIKEMERFSGIQAHTIRTWEKRYKMFRPQRTRGNIRHYHLEDLQLLLYYSLLASQGIRISKLQSLSEAELREKLLQFKDSRLRQHYHIHRLIVYMFGNDTDQFEAVLEESIIAWGLEDAIGQIIIPFLELADILSYRDSSIEVHFAVTAVRRKLILGIERTNPLAPDAATALLFLPKGEHFDLLLLYMNYKLRLNGIKVYYLGTNISLENLNRVYKEKQPDRLYCYLHAKNNSLVSDYAAFAKTNLGSGQLYIAHTGNMLHSNSAHLRFFNYKDICTI